MDSRKLLKKNSYEQLIKSANQSNPTTADKNLFSAWRVARHHQSAHSHQSPLSGRRNMNNTKNHFEQYDYQNSSQSSTLVDYFKLIVNRKWLIALCVLVTLIPAILWIWKATPVYETEATIIYEEANDTAFLLELGQPLYSKSAILNMVEQIKSRALADEVVKRLPEAILNTFIISSNPGENFSRMKYISGIINSNLGVENVRGADIIKIRVQANDPIAVKTIANTYVDLIIEWNLQKKKKEISNIRNFVEGQLLTFQDKLRTAEEDLLTYKENNDLITLSDESKEMLANLTDVEVAYNQTKTEREALEQRRRFIEKKKQELMPTLNITSSDILQQLKEKLHHLERQYSDLQMKSAGGEEEALASLRGQINLAKHDLVNELIKSSARETLADPLSQIRNLLQESITLEVELETYKAREQSLKNTMNGYNQELLVLPKQELALARLIRAKEVNDKIYALLLEKREEARITEAGKVGDVRVIDYAEVPAFPIKPNKLKTLMMALAIGLSCGIGLAFLLYSLDNSIKTDQDVEKYLGLPVIASIPTISNNGVLHKLTNKEDAHDPYHSLMLSQILSKSHIFEAYRLLQLNFSFLNPDRKLRTLLVTSSEPSAGKTLTALNIAQFYAREGTKTIVIDCDLHRPKIHRALKLSQEPGLTNFLISKSTGFDSYTQIIDNEIFNNNLAVMTCGTLPPNPSEILRSKRMEELINELNDSYEFVILDAPPIISVTDSLILGQDVDGVLLVLRSGKTNREVAIKAKKILEDSQVNIVGTLLNDIDLKSNYGYYKDYYYYSNPKS